MLDLNLCLLSKVTGLNFGGHSAILSNVDRKVYFHSSLSPRPLWVIDLYHSDELCPPSLELMEFGYLYAFLLLSWLLYSWNYNTTIFVLREWSRHLTKIEI